MGLDTAEESVRRIANRVARGGHDIPTRDVERWFARRFRDLGKLLPLCNEATFYDNDNGFRVVAMSLWPSHSWICFMGTPCLSSRLTQLCRAS